MRILMLYGACSYSPKLQSIEFITLSLRGLDNAGKTTCIKKFNGEDVNTISPTLGFNIKSLEYQGYIRAHSCTTTHKANGAFHTYSTTLIFWDIGGQKSLRSYWRNYFEQTDGIIWVVDSTDRRRLLDCKAELDKLLHEEVHLVPFFCPPLHTH